MSDFISSFDPEIIGLTGSPSEIASVAIQYRVFYRKSPIGNSGDYFMEHSSYIYVVGPDGRYVTLLPHDQTEAPDLMAQRMLEIITAATDHTTAAETGSIKMAPETTSK